MSSDFRSHPAVQQEQVLRRQLTSGQQAMLAIGGSIGTGLFLGSGLAVAEAGPAVILSNAGMAVLALLLGRALIEMCVAHPTAGSFGVYAGMYVSPFAGYAVRMSYWSMQVIATGGHMVAVSIYMKYWLPGVPGAFWIALFSAAILYLNARAVGKFGEFEYWFVMIKVVAIGFFFILGLGVLFGWTGGEGPGLANYSAHGGFLPRGWLGVWLASCFALYSFIGVEVVAVASGEAADPERTIPQAFRRMVIGLSLIYIGTMIVLVGIMPWTQAGVGESPFVSVLRRTGIPAAAALMNAVVLTSALSSANANLYLVARTLFSLSRSGFMPRSVGAVSHRGVPVNALLIAGVGLALAVLVQMAWQESAYVWFVGVSLFGALLVWFMIFVTHIRFRRAWDRRGTGALPVRYRWGVATSVAGAATMVALLATTWWVPGLDVTVKSSVPWLVALWAGYWLSRRRGVPAGSAAATET
jgi:L-asparagine transporter-like permease